MKVVFQLLSPSRVKRYSSYCEFNVCVMHSACFVSVHFKRCSHNKECARNILDIELHGQCLEACSLQNILGAIMLCQGQKSKQNPFTIDICCLVLWLSVLCFSFQISVCHNKPWYLHYVERFVSLALFAVAHMI